MTETVTITIFAALIGAFSRCSSLVPTYDSSEGKSPTPNGNHQGQPLNNIVQL